MDLLDWRYIKNKHYYYYYYYFQHCNNLKRVCGFCPQLAVEPQVTGCWLWNDLQGVRNLVHWGKSLMYGRVLRKTLCMVLWYYLISKHPVQCFLKSADHGILLVVAVVSNVHLNLLRLDWPALGRVQWPVSPLPKHIAYPHAAGLWHIITRPWPLFLGAFKPNKTSSSASACRPYCRVLRICSLTMPDSPGRDINLFGRGMSMSSRAWVCAHWSLQNHTLPL